MIFSLNMLQDALGVSVTHLVTDSRAIRQGDTFVAYPGEKSDGRQFIAQAIAQGANAVIFEKRVSGPDAHDFAWDSAWNAAHLAVADLRHKAGLLADQVYGTPSAHLWTVGVTGTNGKTSTCHWIAQALNDAGKKCALIGTLGNGFAGALQASVNTTPDAVCLHGLLADYLQGGAQAVAMEVSSHALAQGRVNGVRYDVAMLTNLTRDHLDYHGDMENYAAAKRRLFDWQSLKFAVINLDDAFGAELAEQLRDAAFPSPQSLPASGRGCEGEKQHSFPEVIGYGISESALHLAERRGLRMVYGNLLKMSAQGMRIEIRSSWGGCELNSTLVGKFNAANLLGALAVLLVSDVSLKAAADSLSRVLPVAGRMQKVGNAGQPAVIVDYAHTPDALEKVLLALREACVVVPLSPNSLPLAGESDADSLCESDVKGGRLICVFGCGGDRDRGKRAMMGLVAEKFSDSCIVTSDNPRSENAGQIIREVTSGMSENRHEIIVDRASAIECAIGQARCGDIVLIAGKGHEDYQEIKGVKYSFSDVAVATQALNKWPNGGVR